MSLLADSPLYPTAPDTGAEELRGQMNRLLALETADSPAT